LIFNWKREIEKFLPSAQLVIYHGGDREKHRKLLSEAQIILTSYTTARLDMPFLAGIEYECLILDEAQAIKNAKTQTASTVKQFKSRFRLSITGTPIENHLMELWSHFYFLQPDLFSEEAAFQKEMEAGFSDPRYLRRIKRQIRPFLLRRQKAEVAKDLPEKIEQIVWIEMEASQQEAYDKFLGGIKSNLIKKVNLEGVAAHRMEIFEAIMRLRQICCHPLLCLEEPLESAKLQALLNDLETAKEEGRKVLIYSQFTSMLKLIGKELKERGYTYLYLDGSTKNREEIVTAFQEDKQVPFFLISLKAGGVGLNLTSADYVFLYDPWWNAAAENQAIDRAHRIGRNETVIAKRYVTLGTIEEKMMELKEAKSQLAAHLIDSDEASVLGQLTAEDLLALIS
jgi:SNF2 family DNA or RNA helicase